MFATNLLVQNVAYEKYYYFDIKGVNTLKEIGEKLKAAREDHGVSIEEAAEDLNLRVSQIENIEKT